MQKTVVGAGRAPGEGPIMGKTVTRSRKYHAHVETGEFGEGDLSRSPSAGRCRRPSPGR